MVSLLCMLVGRGGFVDVDIHPRRSVTQLKRLVKAQIETGCAVYDLKLFLAQIDGTWIASGTEDMKALKAGETTPTIEKLLVEDNELQPEVDIETALSNMPVPTCCHVHILVVVPENQVGSVKKQRRYKTLSTESSSRKMLDALAYNLALEYSFETVHCQATIGDVFHAIDTNVWGSGRVLAEVTSS